MQRAGLWVLVPCRLRPGGQQRAGSEPARTTGGPHPAPQKIAGLRAIMPPKQLPCLKGEGATRKPRCPGELPSGEVAAQGRHERKTLQAAVHRGLAQSHERVGSCAACWGTTHASTAFEQETEQASSLRRTSEAWRLQPSGGGTQHRPTLVRLLFLAGTAALVGTGGPATKLAGMAVPAALSQLIAPHARL